MIHLEKKLYFAYGSNMDLNQMAFRCPDAEVLETVRLEGYRLAFRSNGGNRGVATILPDPDSHVDGVLWEISPEEERNLNFYEGFPRLYGKPTLTVVNRLKGSGGHGLCHERTLQGPARRPQRQLSPWDSAGVPAKRD